jgi:serine protease Do
MDRKGVKKLFLVIGIVLIISAGAVGGVVADRMAGLKFLDRWWPSSRLGLQEATQGGVKVVKEESVVIDVVNKASPSVVTIGVKESVLSRSNGFQLNPFMVDPFGFFQSPSTDSQESVEQDIATGFVISTDGLIVTNKHVVSDSGVTYQVIVKDGTKYPVQKIYRDPANDLAIIKIEASGLTPVVMGDSSQLQVGQFVIAIGTALGEFRDTVTTGVISGLGRGITAGNLFEGAEKLDDVIQTDAAINPGNSGGPLLDSSGRVIGINTAVSSQGQNIGFALPINIVKDAIDNFNKTGQFNRPYLGVRYRMIDLQTAMKYEVVQGAFVQSVITNSPADKAGIEANDIVTKLGGEKISGDDSSFSGAIGSHKVGEKITVEIWRDGEIKILDVTLEEAK